MNVPITGQIKVQQVKVQHYFDDHVNEGYRRNCNSKKVSKVSSCFNDCNTDVFCDFTWIQQFFEKRPAKIILIL